MYIPSLFSTSPNGCPAGFNAYQMAIAGATNLNTGARGRLTITANQFTNEFVGENYQGQGTYITDIQLANGESVSNVNLILPPTNIQTALPFWGTTGTSQTINSNITSSAGTNLQYCYDCTQKWRYTIGSIACQAAPYPQFATPLTLYVLTNTTGSITTISNYTGVTFNFCAGTTGSIEGYGPIWQNGGNNAASYYIVSRTAI